MTYTIIYTIYYNNHIHSYNEISNYSALDYKMQTDCYSSKPYSLNVLRTKLAVKGLVNTLLKPIFNQ